LEEQISILEDEGSVV